MRKCKLSKEEIVSLYVTDARTTKEISELAGVSAKQVRNILAEMGVEITERRRTGSYKVNVDFFAKWSAEMAYVLGFILTDGCVNGNSFSIAQKDKAVLERINDAMGSNYPIKWRKNGSSYLYTLNVSRKKMVADLVALGITEKKSLTVDFPPVPTEYLPHFIRGVIDGDGWVQDRGYVMNVTTGSQIFAAKLHAVFNKRGLNGRIAEHDGIYRVWASGKEDVIRLGEWLYENPGDLFLPRKRARFEVNAKRDAVKSAS